MHNAGLGFVIGTACCTSGYLSTCRFESAHEIRQGCMRVGQCNCNYSAMLQNATVIVRSFSKYALRSGTFRLDCFFPRGEAVERTCTQNALPCARRVHPPPGTHAKDPVFNKPQGQQKGSHPMTQAWLRPVVVDSQSQSPSQNSLGHSPIAAWISCLVVFPASAAVWNGLHSIGGECHSSPSSPARLN
jgi:hypothetical protein